MKNKYAKASVLKAYSGKNIEIFRSKAIFILWEDSCLTNYLNSSKVVATQVVYTPFVTSRHVGKLVPPSRSYICMESVACRVSTQNMPSEGRWPI